MLLEAHAYKLPYQSRNHYKSRIVKKPSQLWQLIIINQTNTKMDSIQCNHVVEHLLVLLYYLQSEILIIYFFNFFTLYTEDCSNVREYGYPPIPCGYARGVEIEDLANVASHAEDVCPDNYV